MPEPVPLPGVMQNLPLAHRGLHGPGRSENGLSAFRAALDAGYGIELDLQPSADGEAMVFHDAGLGRLTGREGLVSRLSAAALGRLNLPDGGTVPRLSEVLNLIAGHVPLLIEIKDQSGDLGPVSGALERRTAEVLAGYGGPVAVMSFNPHALAAFRAALPACPAGLTTCAFAEKDWPLVPPARLEALRGLPDLGPLGASFISHDRNDLGAPAVKSAREAGLGLLCWTVRSAAEAAAARAQGANITFEGFLPARDGG